MRKFVQWRLFLAASVSLSLIQFVGAGGHRAPVVLADGASNATFHVNADHLLHPLPEYGYNFRYDQRGQYVMNADHTFNAERVAELQALGPQWIRFPGGTIVNTYDWKRAIGPASLRADNVHGYLFTPEPNDYGPDEAGRFAEQAGASLLMVVPLNRGARDAADLVEYMNAEAGADPNHDGVDWAQVRAANGHPEPYHVKVWEINNESGARSIATWTSWPADGDDAKNDGLAQTNNGVANDWQRDGGSRDFTNQKAVRLTSWADADIATAGTANETFYVKFAPAVASSVTLRVGQDVWTRVDDFGGSGPDDKHYLFDGTTGKITFGDGAHGKIPAAGQFVYVNYTSGPHDGFNAFYEKMKEVDPSIDITATYFGLIDDADTPFDGYQAHDGSWFQQTDGPLNDDGFNEAIARGFGTFKQTIDDQVSALDRAGRTNAMLTMSEYTYANKLTDSSGVNDAHTIAGALMQALAFYNASVSGRVQAVGPNYLFNAAPEVNTMVDKDGVIRAQARTMELFTKHFGRALVETDSENVPSQTLPYRPNKNKTGTVDIPKLVGMAGKSADGSTLYVMIVNTTKTESLAADIELEGFQAPADTTTAAWVLHADSLTATNTADHPNAVRVEPASAPVVAGDRMTYTFEPASVTVLEVAR